MTTADLFLKGVVVGNEVQIRTRDGEVIMRCFDVTPKKAIKKLLFVIETNIAEREARG